MTQVEASEVFGRFLAGEGFQAGTVFGKEGKGAVRVVFGKVTQPPGHGFLDEPVAVVGIAGGPTQNPVADARSSALGWFCLVQGSVMTRAARRVHM